MEPPDELTFHSGGPGNDGYADFGIASDTADEEPDVAGIGNSDNDNDDTGNGGVGHADYCGAECVDSDSSDHVDSDDEEFSLSCGECEGTGLGEESQVEPTIIDFPGKRAGEVCSEGIMSMQQQENDLSGLTENPYHPFTSKVDWELVKWAKLCGPSAMSFTELLNISGVSVRRPIHLNVSPSLPSCMNN